MCRSHRHPTLHVQRPSKLSKSLTEQSMVGGGERQYTWGRHDLFINVSRWGQTTSPQMAIIDQDDS